MKEFFEGEYVLVYYKDVLCDAKIVYKGKKFKENKYAVAILTADEPVRGINDVVYLDASDIRKINDKHFKIGDTVKVIHGVLAGIQGIITNVILRKNYFEYSVMHGCVEDIFREDELGKITDYDKAPLAKFKIGDIVKFRLLDTSKQNSSVEKARIVNVVNDSWLLKVYYKVSYRGSTIGCYEYELEKINDYANMKNERTVKLTLEKAKEWYRNGGELKEIALQAFSEDELCVKYCYGQKMKVNGMAGYVIKLNEYGQPDAWISDKLGVPSIYTHKDCISQKDAKNMSFKNGWHIPSQGEWDDLLDGIKKAMQVLPFGTLDTVMWTSNDSDTMCWWGTDGSGKGTPVRPCFAILRKDWHECNK